jgi:hypothetical protein
MVSYAAPVLVFSLLGSGLLAQSQVPAAPGGAAARPAATAEQQVRLLIGGLQAGKAEALWDFLPASWQQDLDGLVRDLARKVDPKVWEQGMSVMGRVGEIVQSKRAFVLGSQFGRQLGGAEGPMAASLDGVGVVLRALATSDLAKHRGLQQFEGRKFCAGAGRAMMAQLLASGDGKAKAELQTLRVRGVRQDETTATVTIAGVGKPAETEDYRLVEGRWVPLRLTRSWATTIEKARTAVNALPDGGDKRQQLQVRTVLSMVEGVLKHAEEAETQQEFDEAIAPLLQMGKGSARRGKTK